MTPHRGGHREGHREGVSHHTRRAHRVRLRLQVCSIRDPVFRSIPLCTLGCRGLLLYETKVHTVLQTHIQEVTL